MPYLDVVSESKGLFQLIWRSWSYSYWRSGILTWWLLLVILTIGLKMWQVKQYCQLVMMLELTRNISNTLHAQINRVVYQLSKPAIAYSSNTVLRYYLSLVNRPPSLCSITWNR